MYGHPPIPVDRVRSVLAEEWDLPIADIEYSAVGFGSYHWQGSDPLGRDWFVTLDRPDPWPVVDAYRTALELSKRLDFVRAPASTRDGAVAVAVEGYWLSVWPWIVGRTEDGFIHGREDLLAVTERLRRLHSVGDLTPVPSLAEDWALSAVERLRTLIDEAASWTAAGPYVAETAERVLANATVLGAKVDRYIELVDQVSLDCPRVVTHGEPHPGNVVHTEAGLVLIDWDTVRWAPKERDLWMFGDPDNWESIYGSEVSAAACETYRLQWFITEMADFVPDLVGAMERDTDLDVAFREVQRALPL